MMKAVFGSAEIGGQSLYIAARQERPPEGMLPPNYYLLRRGIVGCFRCSLHVQLSGVPNRATSTPVGTVLFPATCSCFSAFVGKQ